MTRLRTIAGAYEEIKSNDPNTAITPYGIRCIVNAGLIPVTHCGKKALFNLDDLLAYFEIENSGDNLANAQS